MGADKEKALPVGRAGDGGGLRFDTGKNRVDLLSPQALEGAAEVLTYGANKYAERNWERGMAYSKVYGPLLRHLLKWWRGEEVDEESGLHHLKHVLCNALFLVHYLETGVGTDDRPKVGSPQKLAGADLVGVGIPKQLHALGQRETSGVLATPHLTPQAIAQRADKAADHAEPVISLPGYGLVPLKTVIEALRDSAAKDEDKAVEAERIGIDPHAVTGRRR